jgi:hypothetical protein
MLGVQQDSFDSKRGCDGGTEYQELNSVVDAYDLCFALLFFREMENLRAS